jgi:hypothetical protein
MTLLVGPQRNYVTTAAADAVAITASDTTADPNGPFYALYVGGTGAIKLTTLAGNDVTLAAVPVGILHVGCTKVFTTGTAATNIVGLK